MCGFLVYKTTANAKNIKLRGQDATNKVRFKNLIFEHYLLHITGEKTIQPYSDNNIFVVYNGEIYNHNFKISDGENIIPLYKKFGVLFPKQLNGEFAIALYDFNINIALFITDYFATKPIWVNGIECASYETGVGGKKIKANTIEIINLLSGETIQKIENYKPFTFDNQKNDNYTDCIKSFENSITLRAKNECFIGLSSGYDSGAISCELNKQNVYYKAFSIIASENVNILKNRLKVLKDSLFIKNFDINLQKQKVKDYEDFYYKIKRENTICIESYKNDYAALALNLICELAAKENRKVYLSGTGADEIFSDYSLIPSQSFYKGKYPEKLEIWPNFYESCMSSYLGKEEIIAGSNNIETRYPFLDYELVQNFLYLTPELKNKFYKNWIHEYLTINNYPFEINKKIGFNI